MIWKTLLQDIIFNLTQFEWKYAMYMAILNASKMKCFLYQFNHKIIWHVFKTTK